LTIFPTYIKFFQFICGNRNQLLKKHKMKEKFIFIAEKPLNSALFTVKVIRLV